MSGQNNLPQLPAGESPWEAFANETDGLVQDISNFGEATTRTTGAMVDILLAQQPEQPLRPSEPQRRQERQRPEQPEQFERVGRQAEMPGDQVRIQRRHREEEQEEPRRAVHIEGRRNGEREPRERRREPEQQVRPEQEERPARPARPERAERQPRVQITEEEIRVVDEEPMEAEEEVVAQSRPRPEAPTGRRAVPQRRVEPTAEVAPQPAGRRAIPQQRVEVLGPDDLIRGPGARSAALAQLLSEMVSRRWSIFQRADEGLRNRVPRWAQVTEREIRVNILARQLARRMDQDNWRVTGDVYADLKDLSRSIVGASYNLDGTWNQERCEFLAEVKLDQYKYSGTDYTPEIQFEELDLASHEAEGLAAVAAANAADEVATVEATAAETLVSEPVEPEGAGEAEQAEISPVPAEATTVEAPPAESTATVDANPPVESEATADGPTGEVTARVETSSPREGPTGGGEVVATAASPTPPTLDLAPPPAPPGASLSPAALWRALLVEAQADPSRVDQVAQELGAMGAPGEAPIPDVKRTLRQGLKDTDGACAVVNRITDRLEADGG